MKNSKKWSIIALAVAILAPVAYFTSTGQMSFSSLGSSTLGSNLVCTEANLKKQTPEYQRNIAQRSSMSGEVTILETKNVTLDAQIEGDTQRIALLERENSSINQEITAVNNYIKTNCASPRGTQINVCAQKRQQVKTLQAKITTNKTKITDLNNQNNKRKNTIRTNQERITKFLEQINQLNVKINAYEMCKNSLNSKLIVTGENMPAEITISNSDIGERVDLYTVGLSMSGEVTLNEIAFDTSILVDELDLNSFKLSSTDVDLPYQYHCSTSGTGSIEGGKVLNKIACSGEKNPFVFDGSKTKLFKLSAEVTQVKSTSYAKIYGVAREDGVLYNGSRKDVENKTDTLRVNYVVKNTISSFKSASWECNGDVRGQYYKYQDMNGCTTEEIWNKFANTSCDNGIKSFSTGDKCDIQLPAVCGNGIREGAEQCDDGNKNEEDGCTNTCQIGPNICDITPDIPQCNTIKVISQDKDVEIDIQKPWKIQYSAPQEYDNSDIVINLVSLDGSQGMSFNSQFYKTTQVGKMRTVDMTVGGTTLQGKYRLKVCYFPKCNETYGESQGAITVLNTAYTPYVVLSTPWSSCQNNTQTRTVTCSKNLNGDVVDMSLCSNSGIYIPTSQRPCDTTTATQYFDTKIKSEGNNKFTISIKNISDRKLANISTISWGLDYITSNCIRTINELFSLYSAQGKHFDPGESISYTCEDGTKSDTINIQSQGLDVVTGDAVKQFVEQKR